VTVDADHDVSKYTAYLWRDEALEIFEVIDMKGFRASDFALRMASVSSPSGQVTTPTVQKIVSASLIPAIYIICMWGIYCYKKQSVVENVIQQAIMP
jgi:hypothetical protein